MILLFSRREKAILFGKKLKWSKCNRCYVKYKTDDHFYRHNCKGNRDKWLSQFGYNAPAFVNKHRIEVIKHPQTP